MADEGTPLPADATGALDAVSPVEQEHQTVRPFELVPALNATESRTLDTPQSVYVQKSRGRVAAENPQATAHVDTFEQGEVRIGNGNVVVNSLTTNLAKTLTFTPDGNGVLVVSNVDANKLNYDNPEFPAHARNRIFETPLVPPYGFTPPNPHILQAGKLMIVPAVNFVDGKAAGVVLVAYKNQNLVGKEPTPVLEAVRRVSTDTSPEDVRAFIHQLDQDAVVDDRAIQRLAATAFITGRGDVYSITRDEDMLFQKTAPGDKNEQVFTPSADYVREDVSEKTVPAAQTIESQDDGSVKITLTNPEGSTDPAQIDGVQLARTISEKEQGGTPVHVEIRHAAETAPEIQISALRETPTGTGREVIDTIDYVDGVVAESIRIHRIKEAGELEVGNLTQIGRIDRAKKLKASGGFPEEFSWGVSRQATHEANFGLAQHVETLEMGPTSVGILVEDETDNSTVTLEGPQTQLLYFGAHADKINLVKDVFDTTGARDDIRSRALAGSRVMYVDTPPESAPYSAVESIMQTLEDTRFIPPRSSLVPPQKVGECVPFRVADGLFGLVRVKYRGVGAETETQNAEENGEMYAIVQYDEDSTEPTIRFHNTLPLSSKNLKILGFDDIELVAPSPDAAAPAPLPAEGSKPVTDFESIAEVTGAQAEQIEDAHLQALIGFGGEMAPVDMQIALSSDGLHYTLTAEQDQLGVSSIVNAHDFERFTHIVNPNKTVYEAVSILGYGPTKLLTVSAMSINEIDLIPDLVRAQDILLRSPVHSIDNAVNVTIEKGGGVELIKSGKDLTIDSLDQDPPREIGEVTALNGNLTIVDAGIATVGIPATVPDGAEKPQVVIGPRAAVFAVGNLSNAAVEFKPDEEGLGDVGTLLNVEGDITRLKETILRQKGVELGSEGSGQREKHTFTPPTKPGEFITIELQAGPRESHKMAVIAVNYQTADGPSEEPGYAVVEIISVRNTRGRTEKSLRLLTHVAPGKTDFTALYSNFRMKKTA
jgi:hypothetical protein